MTPDRQPVTHRTRHTGAPEAPGRPGRTTPGSLRPVRTTPRHRADKPLAERSATYREVFAVQEFATLFLADLFSLVGDQIAAVALAVLLYQSSGSALLAALGYATAYVPWLLGGPILAAWAERLPGRGLMIGCDLARAGLIGLAAVPGLPLPVLGLLVLAAALLAPPFDSARSALIPQVLTGDRYPVGMSIRDAVHQGAQLIGFAAGGALIAVVSAHGALALDAITFGCSALLLRAGLSARPAVAPASPASNASNADPTSLWRETAEGWRAVRADPVLLGTLLLGIAGAAYAIVPEAIATAYVHSLGASTAAVGLIMASVAAGSVAGGLAIGRLVRPARRRRLMFPLALAGAVPLLLVAFAPGLRLSLLLFAAVGVTGAFQVVANATFAQRVPPQLRARAFGLAVAGMYGGQSVAIVLSGAAAQFFAPSAVVAGAGLLGAAGVVAVRRLLSVPAEGRSPQVASATQAVAPGQLARTLPPAAAAATGELPGQRLVVLPGVTPVFGAARRWGR